jgi:hypothetical protein
MDPLELWTARNRTEDFAAVGLQPYIDGMREMILPVLNAYGFENAVAPNAAQRDTAIAAIADLA